MTREPEYFDWVAGQRESSPPRSEPAASARESEGAGHRIISVLTALTGAWTLAGGICYAILWDAYRTFFVAFGLTPQEVGYSRETLLLRAAIFAVYLVAACAGIFIMILTGLWISWDHVHRDSVADAALVCAALGISGASVWVLSPLENSSLEPIVILFVCSLGLSVGLLLGVGLRLVGPEEEPEVPRVAVVLSGVAVVLANAFELFLIAQTGVAPTGALLLILVVNLGIVQWLGRSKAWPLRPFEEPPGVNRPTLVAALRRRQGSLALWSTVALICLLAWAVPWAVGWSGDQYDEGRRTVQSGYFRPGPILSYSVRPAFVHLVDPARDPLKVCGPRRFAASLIAVEGNGWWVLLRPAGEARPTSARVVWLPRDKYLVDLSPMAQLPDREPPATTSANEAVESEPYSWQAPACR